jgi:hypothetical protein
MGETKMAFCFARRSDFKIILREGEAAAEPGFAPFLARREPRPPGFPGRKPCSLSRCYALRRGEVIGGSRGPVHSPSRLPTPS